MQSAAAPTRFWPNEITLVISISMQFEAGGQPAKETDSPFLPVDFPDSERHQTPQPILVRAATAPAYHRQRTDEYPVGVPGMLNFFTSPRLIRVRAGKLDDRSWLRPTRHLDLEQAAWVSFAEDDETFEKAAP